MKEKHGFIFGFAVLLAAAIFVLCGCDTGNNGTAPWYSGSLPNPGSFSVSGTFNGVSFTLSTADTALGALAVTADTNTLSGVLTRGSDSRELQGNYHPGTGTFSVSTAADGYVYNISGQFDGNGVFKGAAAAVASKGSGAWEPSIYRVSEESVTTGTPGAISGATIPEAFRGYWHVKQNDGDGETEQDWFVGPRSITMYQERTQPADTNGVRPVSYTTYCITALKVEDLGGGKRMVTMCAPYYIPTEAQLAAAVAEFLDIPADSIIGLSQSDIEGTSYTLPTTPWVYAKAGNTNYYIGGLSPAQEARMKIFHTTNYYFTYAAEHYPETKKMHFLQTRLEPGADENKLKIKWQRAQDGGEDFTSLAALESATLGDVHYDSAGTR
jgi:hypothetical protein